MNKTERIKAAINGEQCDQIPYAIWTHLPEIDLDPVRLADETYRFFKKYDVDIIKTMNNGMYPIEDFGCKVDYSEIVKGGVAKIVESPIQTPEDWNRIQPVDIEANAYGRELKSLELLLKQVNGEAPVLFTVFSPITTASKLSDGKILEHIKNGHGEVVHRALEVIAEVTKKLCQKAIEMGASGVFFATQLSSYNETTETFYKEFGEPYDLKVLEGAREGWANVLHAHGDNIMFNILKKYPVQIFNWHVWETLPDIDEAAMQLDKCLMGGLGRMEITKGNLNEINNQIYKSIKFLNGRKLILTPGCVLRYPLNEQILGYVREAKVIVERAYYDTTNNAVAL
ncbi:uroporphyrinogen decarboxylase family protein [Fusibacter ferrireducens]|uniref:Uroporphyrinogen decarboxylase n=1 Tax=Fusibacter ferrireducens TaxID=2785058 RepID=A0ABR9ZW48_9FIRM|nr:uroporphyrinogen decarboxylase family protein [Fusibacter ferrireducens]MBF4694693.1 uroporphyrinogen decarboxylase [Fusibacter ferrireducens]